MIEPSLFPHCGVQIGLRVPHLTEIAATRPSLGFLEVHAENYMAARQTWIGFLEIVRRDYRVSVHGVALSLGSNRWSGSIAPSKRARWLGSLLSPVVAPRGPGVRIPLAPAARQSANHRFRRRLHAESDRPECVGNPELSCRGTRSSNPSPSSGESRANSTPRLRRPASLRATPHRAKWKARSFVRYSPASIRLSLAHALSSQIVSCRTVS